MAHLFKTKGGVRRCVRKHCGVSQEAAAHFGWKECDGAGNVDTHPPITVAWLSQQISRYPLYPSRTIAQTIMNRINDELAEQNKRSR